MVKFIVNLALVAAVLVLLVALVASAGRRRRAGRRDHAERRRLILAAFTNAASASGHPDVDANSAVATNPDADTAPRATGEPPSPLFDVASVAALLDLLEDGRSARHCVLARLVSSPSSVWDAGTRAGRNVNLRRQ